MGVAPVYWVDFGAGGHLGKGGLWWMYVHWEKMYDWYFQVK